MTGLPWYKCDPAKFNDGMIGLTRSERGVYITVINAIYIEGGPVKDDPLYWTHVFACTEAAWLKDRAGLLAKGKLFETATSDGLAALMNRRAEDEINNQQKYKSEQAQHGKKGGSKSRRKPRADKGLRRPSGNPKATPTQALGNPKQIERKRKMKILSPIQEVAKDSSGSSTSADVIPLDGRAGR